MNIQDFNRLPVDKKMEVLNKVAKKDEKLTNKNEGEDLFGKLFKNKKYEK